MKAKRARIRRDATVAYGVCRYRVSGFFMVWMPIVHRAGSKCKSGMWICGLFAVKRRTAGKRKGRFPAPENSPTSDEQKRSVYVVDRPCYAAILVQIHHKNEYAPCQSNFPAERVVRDYGLRTTVGASKVSARIVVESCWCPRVRSRWIQAAICIVMSIRRLANPSRPPIGRCMTSFPAANCQTRNCQTRRRRHQKKLIHFHRLEPRPRSQQPLLGDRRRPPCRILMPRPPEAIRPDPVPSLMASTQIRHLIVAR